MGKGLLGPNGGSGGLIEGRFGERCGGNGGRGGSMSGVGEGKVDSMGGMGGGSLAIRSMVSNDGRGGGGLVVEGGIGAGGGEVNGGGVDLGVSKRLLLEVAGEMIGESGGIEVGEVGGGGSASAFVLGITYLKITKPIRRNEERRNNEGPNMSLPTHLRVPNFFRCFASRNLLSLHKIVDSLGGYLCVTLGDKWKTVASIQGLTDDDDGEAIKGCCRKFIDMVQVYCETAKKTWFENEPKGNVVGSSSGDARVKDPQGKDKDEAGKALEEDMNKKSKFGVSLEGNLEKEAEEGSVTDSNDLEVIV
ncbi:ARID DNA-binding domain-containing protein [Tanacetum coccineum]